MNLFKAKNCCSRLKNKFELLVNQIAQEFNKTQPKAFDTSKELVKGGKIVNKELEYLIKTEPKYEEVKNLENQISVIEKYIIKEQDRMKLYEPITYKIIDLRENSHLGWEDISIATGIGRTWCTALYNKYIEDREIDVFVLEK